MAITNTAFIEAMQALNVDGVEKYYAEPPTSIDLSGGYVAFPLMPSGERGNDFASCSNLSKRRRMLYVVVTKATGQSTQAEKYSVLGSVMDKLETALDGLNNTFNFVRYTLEATGNYPIGNSQYWAVVAEVNVADGPIL